MKKSLLLCVLLMLAGFAMAQSGRPVGVRILPAGNVYNLFMASYFDMSNPQTQPVVFTIELTNNTSAPFAYRLQASLLWNGNPLFSNELITAKQPLNPGVKLVRSNEVLTDTVNDTFESGINFNDIMDNNPDFGDVIQNTGRFPDGNYVLTIVALDITGNHISDEVRAQVLTVVNPLALTLVYPGSALGGSPLNVSNTYPNFVWISNLANFEFNIYEIDDPNLSAEEIALRRPYYTYTSDEGAGSSFTYPASAPPLQEGQTYAWQISSKLTSPMDNFGAEPHCSKSEFFCFTISSAATVTMDPLTATARQFLLGCSRAKAQQGVTMIDQGWRINSMRLDGKSANAETLQDVAQKLQQGTLNITGVTAN